MELSWEELKNSANGITAYLCCDGFDVVKEDSEIDNPDINDSDLKSEVMFRLLYENVNYGPYEDTDDVDVIHHENNIETRCLICDLLAAEWVVGKIKNLEEAQAFVDNKIKEFEKLEKENL